MTVVGESVPAPEGDARSAAARFEHVIAHAERVNAVLHGYISFGDPEAAAEGRGPLAGVALAVKDNVDVAGFETTAGSAFYRDMPVADAPPVAALRAAGAGIVGKANLGEFAIDPTCQNDTFGAGSNPWDPERIPGGSSGGSAIALAAGLADLAVGTDAGGSVRIPAAFCGVAGFRPGAGTWGTGGIVGAPWSVDSLGLMAPTAQGISRALSASGLLGPLPQPLDGTRPRIAYLADESLGIAASGVWEQYRRAVDALVAAGHDLVPVSLSGLGDAPTALGTIAFAEMAACHRAWLADGRPYGAGVREPLEQGSQITAVDYLAAHETRARVADRLWESLKGFSHLITPTMPVTAPRKGEVPSVAGDDDTLFTLIRFTGLANLVGAPAMSVFGGCAADGLPVGVQVMGRPGDERGVVSWACAIDDVMDAAFATRRRLGEVMISWS